MTILETILFQKHALWSTYRINARYVALSHDAYLNLHVELSHLHEGVEGTARWLETIYGLEVVVVPGYDGIQVAGKAHEMSRLGLH